ncbi:MAG: hypothetical protein R2729_11405 [Bryobacteraceae bacterium]
MSGRGAEAMPEIEPEDFPEIVAEAAPDGTSVNRGRGDCTACR